MIVNRVFTAIHHDPYHGIRFESRTCMIRSRDGSALRESHAVLVPSFWSLTASNILIDKYIRKRGVPLRTNKVEETGVPTWLQRASADDQEGDQRAGCETDARQVFNRLAGHWTYEAWRKKYFGDLTSDSEPSARAFYDELRYMLAHQMAAPNSPQWFNTGLYWAYGIQGQASGQFYLARSEDGTRDEVRPSPASYIHPQSHACYIQGVEDSLLGEGGIMDTWDREARVFKFGGGSGANFSALRGKGEPLSGGGVASGLMSWIGIGDRSAGAIKSGGTTRRAAKMIIVDADHPDIEEFTELKVIEERKVAALVAGARLVNGHIRAIHEAFRKGLPEHKAARRAALKAGVHPQLVRVVVEDAAANLEPIKIDCESYEFEAAAYATVTGQNANNSVRFSNDFMHKVERGAPWHLYQRTELRASIAEQREARPFKTMPARDLFNKVCRAAYLCADPGVHFGDAVNEWNTCPADGEIVASNPCGEYLFLNDTGCNLASLNLLRFLNPDGTFDSKGFRHACRLWTAVLDITVGMAGYPSKAIAAGSAKYRTLGLGYANLGALLMNMGLPYDSEPGRNTAAAVTALMHYSSYATSAELARELGTFPRYLDNKQHVRRVLRNHAASSCPEMHFSGLSEGERFRLGVSVLDAIDPKLMVAVDEAREDMLQGAEKWGIRNAQVTLCAPTGTIGLLMDCDTTGAEPDFSLVKFKRLAGGGVMKIVNQSVRPALERLGYTDPQIIDIVSYALGSGSLTNAPHGIMDRLRRVGELPRVLEDAPKFRTAMDVRDILQCWQELGLSEQQWDDINCHVCGTMTVEGAPHLKTEHYPVFDCANRCGKTGRRFLTALAHLEMMAAIQPFLSGGISKTVNMPEDSDESDVRDVYWTAWKKHLKDIALYRDGSKLNQPLATSSVSEDDAPAAVTVDLDTRPLEDAITARLDDVSRRMAAEVERAILDGPAVSAASKIVYRDMARRRRLPDRRNGFTDKLRIGNHKIYLRTGEYPDGTLGEIFIDMHRQGAMMRSMANSFAIAVSIALQYGVPLEEFVEAFCHTKFEPSGIVQGHKSIRIASSVLDLVFRDLAIHYLGRADLASGGGESVSAAAHGVAGKAANVFAASEAAVKADRPAERTSGAAVKDRTAELKSARMAGYEGDACASCHHFTLVRAGACLKCDTCGNSSGCS